ncbi:hypothetical protein PCANC_00190 [Puccinia coronata f. sp. avenae]|uniref:Uncharacterized protein n=1 Tax=Puccinia coronata f. sp. avenae TaxID=200324 RepID=A0A2N5W8T4_9BASI|nr:hypothetical protein PCANC_00190 [Puccinia coronata f. sp. avenae]
MVQQPSTLGPFCSLTKTSSNNRSQYRRSGSKCQLYYQLCTIQTNVCDSPSHQNHLKIQFFHPVHIFILLTLSVAANARRHGTSSVYNPPMVQIW